MELWIPNHILLQKLGKVMPRIKYVITEKSEICEVLQLPSFRHVCVCRSFPYLVGLLQNSVPIYRKNLVLIYWELLMLYGLKNYPLPSQ